MSDQNITRRRLLRAAGLAAAGTAAGTMLPGCGTAREQAGGGAAGNGGKTVIKFGYTAVKDNPVAIGYEKFAELMKTESNGEVQVNTFCCNQLGNDLQLLQNVKSGALQMGTSSNNNFNQVTSSMIALELPYLIRSREHYRAVWRSDVGDRFRHDLEKRLGMKILMVMDAAGFRSIETTDREVHAPSDLKGLKLRAANTPIEVATFRHWGADPVSLPYNQVYTALQQGTVDGEILQPIWFMTDKHHEVAHHICDIRYIMLSHLGVINLKYFKSLPTDQQELLERMGRKAEDYEWDLAGKAADEAQAELKKNDAVQLFEPSTMDLTAWTGSVQPVIDKFRKKAGTDVVDKIEELSR